MVQYFDKHGNEIHAGDTIRHDSGEVEKVYATENDDLGINASNEAYLAAHPDAFRECYPLHQFDTEREWEVIKSGT